MDLDTDNRQPGAFDGSKVLSTHPHTQILATLSHLDLSAYVSPGKNKVISAGAFGDISKAQCSIPDCGSMIVAIKRLRFQMEEDTKNLFEREVYVWAKLKHKNVLPLLGYTFDDSGYPMLVSKWMDNGSAWDYAVHNLDCDLVRLAAGIAEGLTYIHNMDVVHSDIKPANIVVSEEGVARICDFGSSRIITAVASHTIANPTEGIHGTPNYLSYELVALSNQSHSKQSDVWSFGMTLYALLAQKHPYAQIPKETVSSIIAARKLPPFPPPEPSWVHSKLEARDIFWSICQLCWNHNPSDRIDMLMISSILRDTNMHNNIFEAHQLSKEGALHEVLQELLATLEAISAVVDDISTTHRNLKSALEAAAILSKKVSKTFKSDKKVVDLVHYAYKALKLVEDNSALRRNLRLLEEPLFDSLQKVKASCDLVMEYRISQRVLSEIESEKLNELILSLISCTNTCNSVIARHNAAIRARRTHDINVKLLKELLVPNESYEYDRPTCLENTHAEIRQEIIDWANSTKSPNVLWLNGVAGCGKSTISRTIAEHFHDISRLGASIFFEREKSDPSSVIPTIAFELAKFDSSVGARIVDQVKRDMDILSAKPARQFSKLLLEPLSTYSIDIKAPVIFILDALDECGTSPRRRDLIQVLRKDLSKLPLGIRVLITSRQEADIVHAFSSETSTVHSVDLDCTSDTSQSDVQRYVQVEMKKLLTNGLKIPEGWPWDANIILLGKYASGLFIWASTAVKLIASSDDPFSTLEGLIRDMRFLGQFGLDDLYATVLRGSGITWENKASKIRVSRVLGLIILGKAPLTIDAMDAFLGFSRLSSSRFILTKLRSIVSYSTSDVPVRLLHASFADYLLSPHRVGDPWSIDILNEKLHHAMRCFIILEDKLRFNICNLETSFISNDDVPQLDERIKHKIPPVLGYACRHWAQSLDGISSNIALCQKLDSFAHNRLLYWFEVLSLTRDFRRLAGRALLDAIGWSANNDPMLSSFLWDAYKLASVFAPPISQGTPHIYVSMLPLTKQDSKVAAHYTKRMTSIVAVARRGVKPATALLKTLVGHTSFVASVTLSADGKRIASGSWDRTVRFWDAESGESISPPLEGHTKEVTSVVFSPDGKLIATGSNDNMVRIWRLDPESDCFVPKLFEGHSEEVNSVAFSPDGAFVVSGSSDSSTCLWEVESSRVIWSFFGRRASAVLSVSYSADGKHTASGTQDGMVQILNASNGQVLLAFNGHSKTVNSIAFSPDSKYIISGSYDKTARLWNIESGQMVPGHVLKHAGVVFSVSFSPNGKRVVSGSLDHTIWVWDVECGTIVSGPFSDHKNCVFSVVFSMDGMRVISGSSDNTVRVWDTESGEAISNGFERFTRSLLSVANDGRRVAFGTAQDRIQAWDAQSGELISETSDLHMADLTSLAFSDDGKWLVSGARDKVIWVWDVASGQPVSGPFIGHLAGISSVMFSPDSKQIVSSAFDRTIRIWNTENGVHVSDPFKGHTGDITSVAFLPDGKHIVSGSVDGSVRVWNLDLGQLVFDHYFGRTDAIKTPSDAITTVAVSPDGTRAVSGSRDGTLRTWDLKNGLPISDHFKGHGVSSLKLAMTYSFDGKYIISGAPEEMIRAWDAESREPVLLPFDAPTDELDLLAFSSNRQYVAYSDRNGIIRISSTSHDRIRLLRPGENSVPNWSMSADGWICSPKGELLLWIPPDIRPSIWLPCTTALFSCRFSTKLDFKDCMIGKTWAKCYDSDLRS